MEETRICPTCREEKELNTDNWYRNKNFACGFHIPRCKKCIKKYEGRLRINKTKINYSTQSNETLEVIRQMSISGKKEFLEKAICSLILCGFDFYQISILCRVSRRTIFYAIKRNGFIKQFYKACIKHDEEHDERLLFQYKHELSSLKTEIQQIKKEVHDGTIGKGNTGIEKFEKGLPDKED